MRFFDSTVVLLFSQILTLLAAFVINLAVSRTLGDTGKGLVTLLIYIPSILFAVSHLGMGVATQYFISRKEGSPRSHLSNAVIFPTVMGLIAIAAFCLTYDFWKPYTDNLPLATLLPPLFGLPLMIIYELCAQQLIAHGRIVQKSVSDIIQTYASLAVICLVLLLPIRSAAWVVNGYILGWGIGAFINLYNCSRIVGFPSTPSWTLFRKSFRYSIWIYVHSAFVYVLTRCDFILIVALQSSIGAGGIYSVAAGLTMPLMMIPYAVQTVFFPKASAQSDEDANRTTPFYFRQLVLVMTGLAVVAALLSHPVLLLFGGNFVDGQVAMLILLVASILRGTGGVLSVHVLGRGRAALTALVAGITLAVALLLNFLLIPWLGMNGAALGMTGAYFVQNVFLIIVFRTVAGGRISQLFAFSFGDVQALINTGRDFLRRLTSRYRPGTD